LRTSPGAADSQATGADISARRKTDHSSARYGELPFLWERPLGTSVAQALGGPTLHRTDVSEGPGRGGRSDHRRLPGASIRRAREAGRCRSGSIRRPPRYARRTPTVTMGLFCNGPEPCIVNVGCQPGLPPSCVGQLCSEPLDRCVDCLSDADWFVVDGAVAGAAPVSPSTRCRFWAGDLWHFKAQGPPRRQPIGRRRPSTDAAWSVGPGGSATAPTAPPSTGNRAFPPCRTNYVTLYLRRTFQVSEPAAIPGPQARRRLRTTGFVAYINGVENRARTPTSRGPSRARRRLQTPNHE